MVGDEMIRRRDFTWAITSDCEGKCLRSALDIQSTPKGVMPRGSWSLFLNQDRS